MANENDAELAKAMKAEDPFAVAQVATPEQMARLRDAEELIEKGYQRRRRSSRLAMTSQALVGYVALAGFFANAYQNWNNKKQAEARAVQDTERWAMEFKRAQDSDKYRAFFETSALATDKANADKRLVGYALLREFVDDKDYNSKATLMLEESLATELRANKEQGLDDERRAAIIAIVTALSETNDCQSLAKAARSIDRVAKRHLQAQDVEETGEVFRVYVRRLVGRAEVVCPTFKDFKLVRRPIRDTLLRIPELGDLKGKLEKPDGNRRLAEILRERCVDEVNNSGVSDCGEIRTHALAHCAEVDRILAGKNPEPEPQADAGPDRKKDEKKAEKPKKESREDRAAHEKAEREQERADAEQDKAACQVIRDWPAPPTASASLPVSGAAGP